jgi:hypothetical protein
MDNEPNEADAPEEAAPKPLRDEIRDVLAALRPTDHVDVEARCADGIMHLLNERGHYLPGCPPAAQILKDAQQFAGQLQLAMLVVRLLRMLNTRIVTPETKGLEKWLNDYMDGRNHGPVGKPMLWPGGLPGLADQLRQWGYQPTPTRPAFVARVGHTLTMQ